MNSNITIVVLELAGGEVLLSCLDAVSKLGLPCAVVCRVRDSSLEKKHQEMGFFYLDEALPIRRLYALEQINNDIIVLIEDTTQPNVSLKREVERVFSQPEVSGASGPVTISNKLPPRYQALGCVEYGRFHPAQLFPFAGNVNQQQDIGATRLPGNFLCYRRDPVLAVAGNNSDEGLIEGIVHHALISDGGKLLITAGLASKYSGKDPWGGRLMMRFHHGWIYGGGVSAGQSWLKRIGLTVKSCCLPVVLSFRAIKFMNQMPEINHPVSVALWICLMETFWAAGEVAGSILGKPQSLSQWR